MRLRFVRRIFLISALATMLAACSNFPSFGPTSATPTPAPTPQAPAEATVTARNAERDLTLGRRAYEGGDYRAATRHLQSALAGRLAARERAVAHKYLAFILCSQSQFDPCRAQFRNAFDANPQFELTGAEDGHPLWGPIYREISAEVAKRKSRR